jgi:hypothetical protein
VRGLPIRDRIVARTDRQAVELASRLAHAEAFRLALPNTAVDFTYAVRVPDGGVDGFSVLTGLPLVDLPTGPAFWQVKSGNQTPDATVELVDGRYVTEELRRGTTGYVLFWTRQPTHRTRETLELAFNSRLDEISPGMPRAFLFAADIEEFTRCYPAVILAELGLPIGGLLGLQAWARHRQDHPFVYDRGRETIRDALIEHAASRSIAPHTLHIAGPSGSGRTRLVLEALDADGIRDNVLVGSGIAMVEPALLSWIAHEPAASLVLVIDNFDEGQRDSFRAHALAADGRLRLITIGRAAHLGAPNERVLELAPLDPMAFAGLMPEGISEEVAAIVHRITGGLPQFAEPVARLLAASPVAAELLAVARSPDIRSMAEELVPSPEHRRLLGLAALFDSVGVEGEMASDLDDLAVLAGATAREMRSALDSSPLVVAPTRGSRSVGPPLVAVMLADEVLPEVSMRVAEWLPTASERLFRSFARGLDRLAGSNAAVGIIRRVLAPAADVTLDHVSARFATLIEAGAVVDPDGVAALVGDIVDRSSPDELRAADQRREVVWALEHVLWSRQAAARGLVALFRLATHESETVGNNATGVFGQALQVYLSGTTLPYQDRIAVARELLATTDARGAELLATSLAHAFELNETRTDAQRGVLTPRSDWRPDSPDEDRTARQEALGVLLQIPDRHPSTIVRVGEVLARSVRAIVRVGLIDQLRTALAAVDWPPSVRARLVGALDDAVQYDLPILDLAREVEGLRDDLFGPDLRTRIQTLLAAEPHELMVFEGRPRSALAEELQVVAETLATGSPELLDAIIDAPEPNPLTTRLLVREFATRLTVPDAYDRLITRGSVEALMGFVEGREARGETDWVNSRLADWAQAPLLAAHVPRLVHGLAPSDARATLAIEVAREDQTSVADVGFWLYGAWASGLRASTVAAALELLADKGTDRDRENALGILDQWLEAHHAGDASEVKDVGLRLLYANAAAPDDPSPMSSLYRALVFRRLSAPAGEVLPALESLISRRSSLDEHDLELLELAAASDGGATTRAVVGVLARGFADPEAYQWLFWLEESDLLSRLAHLVGVDLVMDVLRQQGSIEWPKVLRHVNFGGDELDPLAARIIDEAAGAAILRAAQGQFVLERGAFYGPFHVRLEARLAVATHIAASHPSEKVRAWALEICSWLPDRIKDERDRSDD